MHGLRSYLICTRQYVPRHKSYDHVPAYILEEKTLVNWLQFARGEIILVIVLLEGIDLLLISIVVLFCRF